MARIRSIKPEFWTSAQVLECSTNARLLFLGLLNFCDDNGRHPASAKQVKASVFPADDFDLKSIRGMLDELSTNDLIRYYKVDNTEYFHVTGWHHQRIDKPQPAKYPGPIDDHSKTIPRVIPPDRIGEDKIRKEKKDSRSLPNGNDHEFDQFWNAYPRKIGKKVAHKLFDKALKETTFGQIMLALDRQKPNWRDPKFIPHPATWLGQGRYDDGPTVGSEPAFPVPR